jgi:disulfide bond formation protein DsbB
VERVLINGAETHLYEHRKHRLLTRKEFAFRVARYFGFALLILGFGLGIGIFGYHFVARLGWIDSLLNASMILGGMGPVDTLHSTAAKVFASCYALFSGLAFIGIASLIVVPFAHRILHRFHLDQEDRAQSRKLGD